MTKGSYVRETGRKAGTKHWGRASLPAQCLTPKVQGLKEMPQLRTLTSQDPKGHPLVFQVPNWGDSPAKIPKGTLWSPKYPAAHFVEILSSLMEFQTNRATQGLSIPQSP